MGAELFHADERIDWQTTDGRRTDGQTEGQTDMTKLMVTFRNFVKAPKKKWIILWTRLKNELFCERA